MTQSPTANILAIHNALSSTFPDIRGNVGAISCRAIKYTDRWSQHSYGNATDYYGSPADLERLYRWLVARRGALPITTVCYNRKGGCTTPHLDHLHVSATIMRGLPPCAAGGGTPNVRQPEPSGGGGVDFRGIVSGITSGPIPIIPNPFGLFANPFAIAGDVVSAGQSVLSVSESVGGFIQLLVNPETWFRVLLFAGGATAIGIGITALLAAEAADVLAAQPAPVGPVARMGKAAGGKK